MDVVRRETEEGEERMDKCRKRKREKWEEKRNAGLVCISMCVY